MNLPNRITMLRIIMIPVFIILASLPGTGAQVAALIVFIVASITDWIDGKLARKWNMVTDFGRFIDPIADKLLVMSALVVLVNQTRMPAWVCIVMLSREFLVTGLRLIIASKGTVLSAGMWGKLKTVSQMIYIPAALLWVPIREKGSDAIVALWEIGVDFAMWIAMALAVWSGIDYFYKNRHYLADM